MDNQSILVVEDEIDIREALLELLDVEGYRVSVAANGQEALNLLSLGLVPDLILLDLMMPVMNGSEFVQTIRSAGVCPGVPIVVMSADTQTAAKALELGLSTYLKKPVDLNELLEIVERLSIKRAS